MEKFKSLLLAFLVLILATLACEEPPQIDSPESSSSGIPTPADPRPKGDRILELDANAPEDDDFDKVMELARDLGVESIRLSVYWDDIETAPGVFDPDPNWLAIANQYYSAQGFSISLVISVLDTTEIRIPADLEGREFSDPEMITRFTGLLDYVITQLPDVEMVSLAIGNEIDGVLGNDPNAWQAYQIFYQSSAAYARSKLPEVPVSTKVTFEGLTGPMRNEARAVFEDSEVVMTTYYPLLGDFSVKDPEIVLIDFQTLTEIFPDKEIHITEIGYPTSEVNQSSEAKQTRFIQAMFQAWDEHADQIPVLSYSWLSDLPEESVRELEAYYGLKNQAFGEFLRTLGLRTFPNSGENKSGFDVFQIEANARGW
jgi:hypothetical protein